MAVSPPTLQILILSRATSSAAFQVLLLRYSPVGDGEDIAIGIGDGNRAESEMVDVIAPFVNSLIVSQTLFL